jgi:hypothetical protein
MRRTGKFNLAGLSLLAILTCVAGPTSVASTGATAKLLELQSRDTNPSEFPPVDLRRSVAGIVLEECKIALSRLPQHAPAVGLTEDDPPNFREAQRELARWRLGTAFAACADLSGQIIAATTVSQEVHAWLELARLFADEQTVRQLIELAEILPAGHGEAEAAEVFGIAHWSLVRDAILRRTLTYKP